MRYTTTRRQKVDPNEHSHTAVLAQKETEPSFQEHRVSVPKQRNGSIAEDTKQRWNFITRKKRKKEKQEKKKEKRKKGKKERKGEQKKEKK